MMLIPQSAITPFEPLGLPSLVPQNYNAILDQLFANYNSEKSRLIHYLHSDTALLLIDAWIRRFLTDKNVTHIKIVHGLIKENNKLSEVAFIIHYSMPNGTTQQFYGTLDAKRNSNRRA